MTSRLCQIQSILESNQRVTIVGTRNHIYLPNRDFSGSWSQTVDMFVAPKESLYTLCDLQHCLESLIQLLSPDAVNQFEETDLAIVLGRLTFDEGIGSEQRELRVHDPELAEIEGFTKGKLVITEPLSRRIWIQLYPSIALAQRALETEKCIRTISKMDIERTDALPEPALSTSERV